MAEFVLDLVREYYFLGYVGFTVGGGLVLWNLVRTGLSFPLAVIAYTASIYGGLLGARILFILSYNPHLFLTDPGLALTFWEGGLAWLGGPPLGALFLAVVARLARKPVWETLGSEVPGLALAHAIARIGCVIQGCCYGAPAMVPWAIYSRKLGAKVHPTQVYSMVCELAVMGVLQTLWRKPSMRKYLFPLYCLLLAIHRFVTEAFRGTPRGPELITGVRFYQSICIILFGVSAGILLILWNKRRGALAAAILAVLTVVPFVVFRPPSETVRAQARREASLYLVVTRGLFAEGLAPWVAHREAEGFQVLVGKWDTVPEPAEISEWIREQAGGLCSYLLIVGDCAAPGEEPPPWHIPSTALVDGSPCDGLYGDLDGDGGPDVPVGRLAVRDARQLKTQIAKIRDFESQPLRRDWFRAVVWAGAKGYDVPFQAMLSRVAAMFPDWLDTFVISGVEDSVFSSYLPDQPRTFLDAIAEPAIASLVVSHGGPQWVNPAVFEGQSVGLSVSGLARLQSARTLGPLILLGCDSGKFNFPSAKGVSLAEAFCAHSCGPVAVVSATGPTSPLTNYLAVQYLSLALRAPPETVGDLFLAVQRRVYDRGRLSMRELASGDKVAEAILAAVPERDERESTLPGVVREEILRYGLLGDPACPLRAPSPMDVDITVSDKGTVIASGTTPEGCTELFVDLIDREQKRDAPESDLSKAERRKRFARANKRPPTLVMQPLEGKTWAVEIPAASNLRPGQRYLRFLAFGRGQPYYATYPE